MPIPAWRVVEYTDDGCSTYQCLYCYEKWEGRTHPGRSGWMFCPYCGHEWIKGELICKESRSKHYALPYKESVNNWVIQEQDYHWKTGEQLSDWTDVRRRQTRACTILGELRQFQSQEEEDWQGNFNSELTIKDLEDEDLAEFYPRQRYRILLKKRTEQ